MSRVNVATAGDLDILTLTHLHDNLIHLRLLDFFSHHCCAVLLEGGVRQALGQRVGHHLVVYFTVKRINLAPHGLACKTPVTTHACLLGSACTESRCCLCTVCCCQPRTNHACERQVSDDVQTTAKSKCPSSIQQRKGPGRNSYKINFSNSERVPVQ